MSESYQCIWITSGEVSPKIESWEILCRIGRYHLSINFAGLVRLLELEPCQRALLRIAAAALHMQRLATHLVLFRVSVPMQRSGMFYMLCASCVEQTPRKTTDRKRLADVDSEVDQRPQTKRTSRLRNTGQNHPGKNTQALWKVAIFPHPT